MYIYNYSTCKHVNKLDNKKNNIFFYLNPYFKKIKLENL